jgi:hypothetical protein
MGLNNIRPIVFLCDSELVEQVSILVVIISKILMELIVAREILMPHMPMCMLPTSQILWQSYLVLFITFSIVLLHD